MSRNNKYIQLIVLFVLAIIGLLIPTEHTIADNNTIIGFIIEANTLEGAPPEIVPTTGDTANQRAVPMLKMNFQDASVTGLKIRKLVKTPEGIFTTAISSNDTVLFDTLSLKVTNAEFGGLYVAAPGKIGFREIKLLAHEVDTGDAALPKFSLGFESGGKVELTPKSETELLGMKTYLEGLISSLLPSVP